MILPFSGCGLGYIDIVPEQFVAFRIENDTQDTAEVTIATSVAGEEAAMQLGDGSANDMVIGVPGGSVTSGWTRCGELVTISATVGGMTISTVELTGAGTGTPGFDSGSVGLAGERFLIANTHFACEDTILVRLTAPDSGQIVVVPPGGVLPDPIASPDEAGTSESGTSDASKVTFRLENATATPADITVAIEAGGDDLEGSTPVRVPPAEFTTGEVDCGNTFQITATMADGADSTVLLTGDGTGTIGFDSASIGLSGERLLVFGDDYDCGETIVVRITDDGSGIGLSTSETPLGQVNVFSSGDVVPEPDLPDPDDVIDSPEVEQLTLVIMNQTESTVQVNFATGNGSLAGSGGADVTSQFDVRVPCQTTTTGSGVCAQEYIVAATHLEATSTTYSEGGDIFSGGGGVNYHGVVLTGDGTGTEGFDSNSIAVTRGRLLQLGTHFDCGDMITVTITATNNQLKLDDEGNPVTDEFGNPQINYSVGNGFVTVTGGD